LNSSSIRPKERDAIIQSLRAGVVPRLGLQHIQVGRAQEVNSLIADIDRLKDGGSSIRFIIGEYGSGKTFFLHLVRLVALEKGLLTVHADLTPDRRLHATGGQARSLFAELMKNLASRTKPDGGALPNVVEKFISAALADAKAAGKDVSILIQERLHELQEMVGGYDFAEVIAAYWKGHNKGNDQLKSDAIRWLRGEFSTKTDARAALGVRTFIDDANVYDHLKLFARFSRLSGYGGVLVALDELVNLYKLANVQARNANYEQMLRILNDCLQGNVEGLGFLMCGTPDFLMDARRGMYSYPALQSRVAENTFARGAGVVDYNAPVIRLSNLIPEDLFVLLGKIRHVFAQGNVDKYLIPDDGVKAFMEYCSKKIGDAYFRTPRTTIRSFIDFLSVLDQTNNIQWQALLGNVRVEADVNPDNLVPVFDNEASTNEKPNETGSQKDDDELTSFKL
jgi:hypothetical protein